MRTCGRATRLPSDYNTVRPTDRHIIKRTEPPLETPLWGVICPTANPYPLPSKVSTISATFLRVSVVQLPCCPPTGWRNFGSESWDEHQNLNHTHTPSGHQPRHNEQYWCVDGWWIDSEAERFIVPFGLYLSHKDTTVSGPAMPPAEKMLLMAPMMAFA